MLDADAAPFRAIVCETVVTEGRVVVSAAPDALAKGLHLVANRVPLPLEPVEGAPEVLHGGGPLHVAAHELGPVKIHVNALPDWSLPVVENVQIEFPPGTEATQVALVEGRTLLPKQAFVLTGRMAIHRAKATLVVTTEDASGQVLRTWKIPFNPSMIGGTVTTTYQQLAVEIPASEMERRLSVEVQFAGNQPGAEQTDAFAFIADLRLMAKATGGNAAEILIRTLSSDPAARWSEAVLPEALRRGGRQLDLTLDGLAMSIAPEAPDGVEMVADEGHTLVLRAARAGTVLVRLDGEDVARLPVSEANAPVRLPSRFLTGEPSRLTVWDTTGTFCLFETWVLPPRLLTPFEVLSKEAGPPFDRALLPQSRARFDGLRDHLAAGSPPEVIAQLGHAIDTLEAGYARVKLRPLAFSAVESPDVSVVIPAHNKVEVTYSCLCALLLAWNKASFEVILVDDASTDETAEIETVVSGITVVRNEEAQRFIRACNAGVAASRGRYVVLLNNDTEPTTRWLDELIAAMARFPKAGLVGSKLLFPDGRLQDAGGIIWGTGNPWNYGSRQNPHDPRFTYARQADYLSGAAMLTTRAIWDEVGGLSSYLEPMYFEDTDFAFKVREAGYQTWYVPSSVVYHYEGMTSGTSTASGFKRFQEVNRPKFKRRWARAFTGFGPEGVKPDLEKDRGIIGRVLFIDYTTPRPDIDAGSYAAVQEIRLVQSLGYKVTFLPENLAHLGRYTHDLEKLGVEMIVAPFVLSVPEFLERRGAEFDAVYITRYHVAENTLPAIRAANPRARVILNNADLHFLRELRLALAEGSAAQLAAVEEVRRRELEAMRKVDLVLSYSDVEHAVIQSHTDGAVKVMRCPWVVEPAADVPPFEDRAGLSFLGSFRHTPNAEAAAWFAERVMRPLAEDRPDIVLHLYGSAMTDAVRALAADNIRAEGFVERVEDAYDGHRIFVAPLLSGAGIKGKVLTALARRIPCILSPIAAEGIGLRHGHDCLIAATPEDWLAHIRTLYDDARLCDTIAWNAASYVAETFSFAKGRAEMRAAFEAVDLFGSLE